MNISVDKSNQIDLLCYISTLQCTYVSKLLFEVNNTFYYRYETGGQSILIKFIQNYAILQW